MRDKAGLPARLQNPNRGSRASCSWNSLISNDIVVTTPVRPHSPGYNRPETKTMSDMHQAQSGRLRAKPVAKLSPPDKICHPAPTNDTSSEQSHSIRALQRSHATRRPIPHPAGSVRFARTPRLSVSKRFIWHREPPKTTRTDPYKPNPCCKMVQNDAWQARTRQTNPTRRRLRPSDHGTPNTNHGTRNATNPTGKAATQPNWCRGYLAGHELGPALVEDDGGDA